MAEILVVDDNALASKVMRLTLEAEGYAVSVAAGGATALAWLERETPGLVIQNLMLPDIDGLELTRRIRALPNGRTLPIVVASELVDDLQNAPVAANQYADVLVKPVTTAKLVAVVRAHLPKDRPSLLPGRGLRVLLVDDSPSQRKLDQRRFAEASFHVILASSADEALSAVGDANADVVVSDVLMPGMDGFELCRRIRTSEPTAHIPVVLVSAYRDERDFLHAKRAGANALVERGPSADELVDAAFEAIAVGASAIPNEALRMGKDSNAERLLEKLERYAAMKRVADEQLHASESRFHELVDAVTDYAICMLDATGHVATWNAGARRNKGYEARDILGRHFSVFYPPEDRDAGKPNRVLEIVRREGRFEDEGWRVRQDGTRFWANVVITSLRNRDGEVTGFAKVTRDLSAKRAAEDGQRQLAREQMAREASELARREMERVNRLKDEFLATMSHELRTPLNAITGWAAILRKKPRDEAKLDRGLEVIERNARAQVRLVSDLLDVSRIINGKLQLNIAKLEVLPSIAAAADVVRPAADGKGVRLIVEVDPEIGSTMADSDRLQQIIWNLLTNAVRFTPRGGRVTIRGDRAASGIQIIVRDTGAGIAMEHLPFIFERFKQVDSSTTRSHGGLGLGLAIVRHLVEAHGGSVEVESEGLGLGATFTVFLPIGAVNTAPADPPSADTAKPDSVAPDSSERRVRLDGLRVLVVDDDEDSLEILREVLELAGAQVTAVTSARLAFAAIDGADERFELVISDVGMPETDGYSFIRTMRARGQAGWDVPAIALTAYARAADATLALDAGFQQHLIKPVDEQQLLHAVEALSAGGRKTA